MKIKTLAVLAGVSAPAILGGSASAGFFGISTTSKPNEFGLLVVNVYAGFDRPGEDHMIAVAGTPNNQATIEVIGGTFYQHPFSTDQAPNGLLLPAFPSLAYDTFVTIGVKCFADPPSPCQPVDDVILFADQDGENDVIDLLAMLASWGPCPDPCPPFCTSDLNGACQVDISDFLLLVESLTNFPGFGASVLRLPNGGWGVTVASEQGDPFNPNNSFPGNGMILIGQFSTMDGTAIQGTMLLQYISNNVLVQSVEKFFGGCDDADCDDGNPCNGQETCVLGDCQLNPPVPDCNGNGILDSCDIANNTSTDADGDGIPDDCEVLCQSDLDNDGIVGIVDFLKLLADWGVCP